jgi:hypothetical protein
LNERTVVLSVASPSPWALRLAKEHEGKQSIPTISDGLAELVFGPDARLTALGEPPKAVIRVAISCPSSKERGAFCVPCAGKLEYCKAVNISEVAGILGIQLRPRGFDRTDFSVEVAYMECERG